MRVSDKDVVFAAVLWLATCLVQGVALFLTPFANGGQLIFGAPVADAFYWHQLGTEISNGEGISGSLRPGYSVVLAMAFQFAGNGLGVAKAVNVALASGTVAISYLVFRYFVPIPAALVFAGALATSPVLVMYSHVLLSEHAGLFFLMLGLLAILFAAPRCSKSGWALAGVATALSNLSRPLTLTAIPFIIGAAWINPRTRKIGPLAIFVLSTLLVLAPWIVMQKAKFGAWSVSSNTDAAFYAATSPAYGRWTGHEKTDLIAEGAISAGGSVVEWRELFRQRALANLKAHPEFWIANVNRSIWASLNDPGLLPRGAPRHALLAVALALFIGLAYGWRLRATPDAANPDHGASRWRAYVSAAALLGVLGFSVLTGTYTAALFASCICLIQTHRSAAILLIAYFLGNVVSHVVFGFSTSLDRLALMHAPIVAFLHLFAFYSLGVIAFGGKLAGLASTSGENVLGRKAFQLTARRAASMDWLARATTTIRVVAVIAVVGILWAAVQLLHMNLVRTHASPGTAGDPSEFPLVLDHAIAEMEVPQSVREQALDRTATRQRLGGSQAPGTYLVTEVRLPYSRISVPQTSILDQVDTPSEVAYVPFFGVGTYWTIFCGPTIDSMLGKSFFAVARFQPRVSEHLPPLRHLEPILRVIYLVPIDGLTGRAELEAAIRFGDKCYPVTADHRNDSQH